MRVLAIDPGSTCGWAFADTEKNDGASGVWDIRPNPKRGDSPGMRYLKLHAQLKKHLPLDLVVYELQHHRGGAATEYAIGCSTTIQAFCAANRIEHSAVHSAIIKSFVLGRAPKRKKGDPKFDRSKDAVMAAARVRWPEIELIDDNHADALWLAAYALTNLCAGRTGA